MEVSLCDLLDWISFLTPLTRESVRRQFDSWHFFYIVLTTHSIQLTLSLATEPALCT